ncbi:hypothetical protein BGL48_04755 [Salinivibrio sp. SS3]|nr:hypothetical protein BGL48_04755 [Salinivibrio sp. BNH]
MQIVCKHSALKAPYLVTFVTFKMRVRFWFADRSHSYYPSYLMLDRIQHIIFGIVPENVERVTPHENKSDGGKDGESVQGK